MFRVSFVTEILFGSGVGDLVLDRLLTGDRDRLRLSRPGGDLRLTGDRDRLRIIGDRDLRRGGDPPRRGGDLDRRLGDIDLLGLRLNDGDRRLLGDGDRRLGDLRLGDGLLRPRPRGDGLLRPPLPRGDGDRLLTGDLRRSPPRSPPLRRSTGDLEEPDDDDELDDEDDDEDELELELEESRRPRPFRSRDLDLGMISVRQSKSDSKMG